MGMVFGVFGGVGGVREMFLSVGLEDIVRLGGCCGGWGFRGGECVRVRGAFGFGGGRERGR